MQVRVALFRMGHTVGQAPQWSTSLGVCTSHPLATTESQSAYVLLQLPMAHALLTHAGVPLGVVHTVLQSPQLLMSALTGRSQPVP